MCVFVCAYDEYECPAYVSLCVLHTKEPNVRMMMMMMTYRHAKYTGQCR